MHHDPCAAAGVCDGRLVCRLSRRHTAEVVSDTSDQLRIMVGESRADVVSFPSEMANHHVQPAVCVLRPHQPPSPLPVVQQRPRVRYSSHAGISGAADKDAAADARSDDHRQPSNRKSAGPAGGGMYT